MKDKIKAVLAYGLMWGIFLVITGGIFVTVSIFAAAVMKLLGFEYDSVWSILFYFLIVGMLGFPLDAWTSGLPNVLIRAGRVSIQTGIALRLLLETICSSVIMRVVDHFLDSVEASDLAIVVVSFLMALLSLWMDVRKPKRK